MKTPDGDDDLVATFVCKDPDSTDAYDCPAYYTTNRDSVIWQGKKRGPKVAQQLRNLADDETFCEVPLPLLDLVFRKYAKERYGLDLGGGAKPAD